VIRNAHALLERLGKTVCSFLRKSIVLSSIKSAKNASANVINAKAAPMANLVIAIPAYTIKDLRGQRTI
jgi:hypothetical protein